MARVTDRAIWSAPGRVNLIGEHTDYNDGFVLPFTLPQRTTVTAARTDAPQWTARSTYGAAGSTVGSAVGFTAADLSPGRVDGWAGYVAGVVWVLREQGIDVPFADLSVTSDVPIGAGLSSSAALECATLAALLDLAGVEVPRGRWPELARRAENAYVGMPCGILDQSAVVHCRTGHALFLDCRTLVTEHVPFDLAGAGLAMLVVDTRAPHRHAGGEYATRRATCEAAAKALGLPALRDVTDLAAALSTLDDEVARRRTRHVVTENRRVLDAVELLRAGRLAAIGPLLTESHASLRDDFEVTVPELDVAVDAAVAAGALGARMTGGGFGGCVIALVERDRSDAVVASVGQAFAEYAFAPPVSFPAVPSDGVRREIQSTVD
jgi:galactokinase